MIPPIIKPSNNQACGLVLSSDIASSGNPLPPVELHHGPSLPRRSRPASLPHHVCPQNWNLTKWKSSFFFVLTLQTSLILHGPVLSCKQANFPHFDIRSYFQISAYIGHSPLISLFSFMLCGIALLVLSVY